MYAAGLKPDSHLATSTAFSTSSAGKKRAANSRIWDSVRGPLDTTVVVVEAGTVVVVDEEVVVVEAGGAVVVVGGVVVVVLVVVVRGMVEVVVVVVARGPVASSSGLSEANSMPSKVSEPGAATTGASRLEATAENDMVARRPEAIPLPSGKVSCGPSSGVGAATGTTESAGANSANPAANRATTVKPVAIR